MGGRAGRTEDSTDRKEKHDGPQVMSHTSETAGRLQGTRQLTSECYRRGVAHSFTMPRVLYFSCKMHLSRPLLSTQPTMTRTDMRRFHAPTVCYAAA